MSFSAFQPLISPGFENWTNSFFEKTKFKRTIWFINQTSVLLMRMHERTEESKGKRHDFQ